MFPVAAAVDVLPLAVVQDKSFYTLSVHYVVVVCSMCVKSLSSLSLVQYK